jgi:hypothetical protein
MFLTVTRRRSCCCGGRYGNKRRGGRCDSWGGRGKNTPIQGPRGHHNHHGKTRGPKVKYWQKRGRGILLYRCRSLYNGLSAGLQRQMCFASVRLGLYDTTKAFYQSILDSGKKFLIIIKKI